MKKTAVLPLPTGLYLVATPIGNLRDITLRALDVLEGADLVLCEDTRVSGKLLEHFSLKKKLLSYNDHNADQRRGKVLEGLAAGQAVALVSDAGMPLVSDPGYKLVRDCIDAGFMVTTVPGANAPLAALQLSGLPSDSFLFAGFLPPKSGARKTALQKWAGVPATLIFFETGPRLFESLKDMAAVLGGDRPATVAREITKKFEECRRGTLSQLVVLYEQDGPPKGEIVVVVGGAVAGEISDQELEEQVRAALQTMSVKEAAAYVSEKTGKSKKVVYDFALRLKG